MDSKNLTLQTPVSELFMVGPVYAKRLTKLGIERIEDLLYHFPHRYEDYSIISPISRVQPGETVTIKGKIKSIRNEYTKKGRRLQKAIIEDETGSIEVTWFNQPFLIGTLKPGGKVSLAGKVDFLFRKPVLVSPEYERVKGELIHTGRLVPIYPETSGVSSKWLRSRIAPLLSKSVALLEDWLPEKIKKTHKLLDLKEAIKVIHFPENKSIAKKAKERLAFEEMFLIHLATLMRKKLWQKKSLSHRLFVDQEKILGFMANLPFELTGAQKRCVKEILADLSSNQPMNRLLEGDVASGKTVVATIAMYTIFLNGFQSALMAPTEILANQHYQTIKTLLKPYGAKIALLTGSKKFDICPPGGGLKFDILIGTHALIHQHAQFENLGLVVIDEQHRFGVEQRAKLVKKGKAPHILTMTATPIPRTIALTLYGDLDLSLIDEMPPGKAKIKTWFVPPEKRESGYEWIKKQIEKNNVQAFIICPLIEESEKEKMKDVKAATAEYERLKRVFLSLRLGLLHGRLKSKEKEKVIEKFRKGGLDILVSTPVVEVGIDIPQATIMMIEGADRFGLAQLHQLRGRVGRRTLSSYCFLFTESSSPGVFKRLKYLEKTNIGMKLAEYDLELRGPGELLGTKQHGFPDLRAASFTDAILIKKTRQAAGETIDHLDQFPLLKKKLEEDKIKTTYATSS